MSKIIFTPKARLSSGKNWVFQRTLQSVAWYLRFRQIASYAPASTTATSSGALVALRARRKIDKTQKEGKLLTISLEKSQISDLPSDEINFALLCSSNRTLLDTFLFHQLLDDLCTESGMKTRLYRTKSRWKLNNICGGQLSTELFSFPFGFSLICCLSRRSRLEVSATPVNQKLYSPIRIQNIEEIQ